MLNKAVAPATLQVYKRAWALCRECMAFLNLQCITINDLPLDFRTILLFVSYLHLKGLAPSSIVTYISAIGYVHKIFAVPDPTSQFVVQKILGAITKLHSKADSRLPITQFILHRLLESVDKVVNDDYLIRLIKAMFLLAFYGLFRVGEITIQTSGVVSLKVEQLHVFNDRFVLNITNFKNNKTNKPFDIVVHCQQSNYCPYVGMLRYLQVRKFDSGPLFRFKDGAPVTRSFFTSKLKDCISFCGLDPKVFKSHSFRMGGASFLASIGKSDLQIQLLGRWSSNSFLRYIRNQKFNVFSKS